MPRTTCSQCLRPQALCYCHLIQQQRAGIDLVILQHPQEAKHPLNSARIAKLGISNCQLWVGEDFSEHQDLQQVLAEKACYLLFPGSSAQDSAQVLAGQKPEVIIILDGTWRKARRIYYCNRQLQQLPAIILNDTGRSNYRIRKVPGDNALSTVEATVTLLRQVCGCPHAHSSLITAFEWMIDQQIHHMGEGTWQKNYRQKNSD